MHVGRLVLCWEEGYRFISFRFASTLGRHGEGQQDDGKVETLLQIWKPPIPPAPISLPRVTPPCLLSLDQYYMFVYMHVGTEPGWRRPCSC